MQRQFSYKLQIIYACIHIQKVENMHDEDIEYSCIEGETQFIVYTYIYIYIIEIYIRLWNMASSMYIYIYIYIY
jgi:hypothetical protein